MKRMRKRSQARTEPLLEVDKLRERLKEAEEALRAIRSGEVDAAVIPAPQGDRVFTLRGAERPYRIFVEKMNEGAVTLKADGTILYANQCFANMVRRPLSTVIGSSIHDLVTPTDRQLCETLVQQGLTGTSKGEISLRAADGSLVPTTCSLNALPMLEAEGVCMIATDISDRKQREEAMARLAAVVASSDDAIVSTDLDGLIRSWNAAAERLFGYSAAEVLGRSSGFLQAPGHVGEMEWGPERLRRQAQVRYETSAMRKDGTMIDIGLTAFSIRDSAGRGVGFSAILRDISEQRRAEQERQEKEILKSEVNELTRRTHEISVLSELGDVLRSAVRLAEAYPVIPRFVRELFPLESGALYEFNEAHNLLEAVLSWGDAPPLEDAFVPSECWALRRGQMHHLEDPGGEMICQHMKAPILAGSLCIPLTARGKTLGLLHLMGMPEEGHHAAAKGVVGEYRQRLAKTVAQQISSALFDLSLQETLRDQAIRDPLTGLFNRRYMEEALHRELYRAARKKAKVGFLLFDLDHFKGFNDRFGHKAGDATLRDVSAFVQKNARAEDILCRYGGEEFLLVLSDCSTEALIERAEQIREGVKQLRLEHEQNRLGDITLSIGGALFPDHGRTLGELFQAADAALYQAKRAGRDQVVLADPLRFFTVPGRSPEKEIEH
jgi:diguanylate cyclase (GGDEF)-like protein/PAS domain S-box-containing protein